jgi:benzoate membrane transport protein
LPFVTRTFTELGNERLMIAAVLLAWLASRKVMGATFPAILPALIAGVTVAAARDEFGSAPANWEFPGIDPTVPAFSFAAIMTVVPVFVALASFHANLTAVTYLRSQAYTPPARLIEVVTGCGSVVGSLFGPIPVNMGALVTPLTAGPEAGERDVRVWSVYFSSGAFLLIGLAGIFAARLPQVMPLGLLLAVAGLALVPVLAQALAEMSRGPVQLGPVLTFAVTVSGVSIFDLGSPFWGIVIGSATALLLDREQAVSLTATARPPSTGHRVQSRPWSVA